MADFLKVNGFFSRIWYDGNRYKAYFNTGMRDYYVMGFEDSSNMLPMEHQKVSLELQRARDKANEPIMMVRGQKALYYVKKIGPDLSHRAGLFKYLTSSIFDGVGEKTANRLLDLYGADVLEVIQTDPARLEADGIKKSIIDVLVEGINNPDVANCIMQWLPDMPQACAKIIGDYYTAAGLVPDELHAYLSQDPYQVYRDAMEYCTLSSSQLKAVFMAIDHYALLSGRPDGDKCRINAAIDVAIRNLSMTSGSTYLDVTDPGIYEYIMNECVSCLMYGDIKASLDAVVPQLGLRYSYCGDDRMLYTQRMLRAEQDSAAIVKALMDAQPAYSIPDADLDALLDQYRTDDGHELDEDQKRAVRTSVTRRLTVITGGPGTGKTTVLDAIVWVWKQILAANEDNIPITDPAFYGVSKNGARVYYPLEPHQIFLMAPTGKAAQRMNEKVMSRGEENNATTIAMRLTMAKKERNPRSGTPTYYKNKLAIVDETSMVSMTDAASVLRLMKDCQLVFVGDPDQLLPVGPGQFLADLITSLQQIGHPSLVRLTRSHRIEGQDVLNMNADIIRDGGQFQNGTLVPCMPAQWPGQYEVIEKGSDGFPLTDEQVRDYAVQEYVKRFRQFGSNTCLITPMHPGPSPVCNDRNLNILIQNIVNPATMLDSANSYTTTVRTGDIDYTGQLFGLHPDRLVDWNDPHLKANWGGDINEAAYYEYQVNTGKTMYGLMTRLRIGDRVMVTKNNYAADMYNGDTGTIVGYLATPGGKTDNLIIIVPDTPRISGVQCCCIRSGRFNEIDLGYCLSAHKTQGSEYDHVILALPQTLPYKPIGNRSTLYTAETRAKTEVMVIGRAETVWGCITKQPPVRQTKLVQRLLWPAGCIIDPDLSVF